MSAPRSPEVIVALDVDSAAEAGQWVERLADRITWYKIGLELFCAEGPATLAAARDHGKSIFLDLKLHDIPRTVARAVQSASRHGVQLMTVHAAGGKAMLREAASAAKDHGVKLVAVTTLTSLDQSDLADLGINRALSDQALALADLALTSGIDGLVTSVHEADALRQRFGNEPILVTPGIRLSDSDTGDQKRIATPAMAVESGSNYLVVGRPILEAIDPSVTADQILQEIDKT